MNAQFKILTVRNRQAISLYTVEKYEDFAPNIDGKIINRGCGHKFAESSDFLYCRLPKGYPSQADICEWVADKTTLYALILDNEGYKSADDINAQSAENHAYWKKQLWKDLVFRIGISIKNAPENITEEYARSLYNDRSVGNWVQSYFNY